MQSHEVGGLPSRLDLHAKPWRQAQQATRNPLSHAKPWSMTMAMVMRPAQQARFACEAMNFEACLVEEISTRSHEFWRPAQQGRFAREAMEAGLVGDSKSFIAREAMEHGYGHGYEACLVGKSHAKPWRQAQQVT